MHRRHFLTNLLGFLAAGSSPAFAAAKVVKKAKAPKVLTAPPAPKNALVQTAAQLKEQILEDLRDLGRFRLLYTCAHPDPDWTHLVIVNTAFTRVEAVIAAHLSKRHAIVLSPGANPEFALLPEIDGSRCVLVSLHTQKVVAEISPHAKDHWFSGHAVFSPDGKTIYIPEYPIEQGAGHGYVAARSVPGLKVERSFLTGRYRPHNLLLSSNEKVLLVGHYGRSVKEGEPPSDGGLALLELPEGKILPAALPENPYLALCHIERDDSDHVFISTRSWIGHHHQLMSPVLFGSMKGEAWESRLPDELKERFRFNFSLRLAKKSGILGVAHIEGKMASFWDTKEKKFLGIADLGENPLGLEVTPDERYFLVNTQGGGLFYLDGKTQKIIKRTGIIGIGYCPHISVLPVNT